MPLSLGDNEAELPIEEGLRRRRCREEKRLKASKGDKC
jgi:hypothetical protein